MSAAGLSDLRCAVLYGCRRTARIARRDEREDCHVDNVGEWKAHVDLVSHEACRQLQFGHSGQESNGRADRYKVEVPKKMTSTWEHCVPCLGSFVEEGMMIDVSTLHENGIVPSLPSELLEQLLAHEHGFINVDKTALEDETST